MIATMRAMGQPVIVPRAEHSISRKQIDADALKVLYRLHQNNFIAYLVGGSVRDLLLGRHPKDFDIGTDAHPYQVKRLFRNCWIIGRRYRLAHVRFGMKTIEVATFRRQVSASELAMANDSAYGLTAGLWTQDVGRALRVSSRIEAGMVWVNTYRYIRWSTPYGGFKGSGWGRENGIEALDGYLDTRTTIMSTTGQFPDPYAT